MEAITENLPLKQKLFAEWDKVGVVVVVAVVAVVVVVLVVVVVVGGWMGG